jgi:MFS family permease
MATTSFFRALGGALGAAVLGAVFAAQAGAGASRADVIDGVQSVFIVAAPIALLALLLVLRLREVPLQASGEKPPAAPSGRPVPAGATR